MSTTMIHFQCLYAADITVLFQNITNSRTGFECTVFTTHYSNINNTQCTSHKLKNNSVSIFLIETRGFISSEYVLF